MNKPITLLTALLACSFFVMPIYAKPAAGPEEGLNVKVLNEELEIANDQGNSLSVSVDNEPTVHVGSMPAAVENEPFQIKRESGSTGSPGGTFLFYTVPEDKRLVIEFVSTAINLPLDFDVKKFNFQIWKNPSESPTEADVIHFAPPLVEVYNNASSGAYYKGSQKVLIHAGPGHQVIVELVINAGGGSIDSYTTMSGYLVPVSTTP